MKILGLTGSIAMGKSTTVGFFRARGIPVHDADAAVHALYRGKAVEPLRALVPQAVREDHVDRVLLSQEIRKNPAVLKEIEPIVHHLVGEDRRVFLEEHKSAPLVLFDVPLLFETQGHQKVDCILTVSCPPALQKARALARENMSEEKFNFILSQQMPDSLKRQKSHYVIETGQGLDYAQRQVHDFLKAFLR